MSRQIQFSHSMLIVCDARVQWSGLDWTGAHGKQGFARTNEIVNIGMLPVECGEAVIELRLNHDVQCANYDRAFMVPFTVASGRIRVEGPEDDGAELPLASGDYSLLIAIRVLHKPMMSRIEVQLGFDRKKATTSRLLKIDSLLHPEYPLIETADIA